MKKKIVIIHTENPEAQKIMRTLNENGYDAAISDNKKECSFAEMLFICEDSSNTPEFIRSLRKQFFVPIIVLSKNYDEKNVVESLDAGAHDFLALPFGNDEHFARVRSAFRNSKMPDGTTFSLGELSINYQSRMVVVCEKNIHLTPIEFRIVAFLAKNQGDVLSHEQIINEIWGPFNSDNLVLRVNITNIRRKIEKDPASPKYILTEMGVGYRMAE
ncbi:MAG: response regulator transcription factor [Clostridiales bacterium]|jgi:two-component system KDP operon response regulator KdpE|nr:response regulator transcription factor [Clostridiales bacterium]